MKYRPGVCAYVYVRIGIGIHIRRSHLHTHTHPQLRGVSLQSVSRVTQHRFSIAPRRAVAFIVVLRDLRPPVCLTGAFVVASALARTQIKISKSLASRAPWEMNLSRVDVKCYRQMRCVAQTWRQTWRRNTAFCGLFSHTHVFGSRFSNATWNLQFSSNSARYDWYAIYVCMRRCQ